LENLKNQIGGIDGRVSRHLMPLAVEPLDSALSGGLALGRVHMLCGMMQAHGVVSGFATALVRRLVTHLSATGKPAGPVVWCPASSAGGAGMLYGHGLAALGLDPAGLMIVDTPHPARRMAALDDIARTDGLAAVVAEYDGMQKSSDYWMRLIRRIQLAAEASRVTVFLLGAPLAANGCETVWHIAPSNHARNTAYAPVKSAQQLWQPAWQVRLQRARGGYPFQGHIGWDLASGRFTELTAVTEPESLTDSPAETLFDRTPDQISARYQNRLTQPAMRQAL
jgi:protein ImuA